MARVRLQRFIAQAGVAARRKAEQLIVDGRVRVNGRVVTELGTKVDPARDKVVVNGELLAAQELMYVLLNKPKACVTAAADDRGRGTVMDYLPSVPVRVTPVGRLDYYTEGVLLLTNDGELSAALQSPKTQIEKVYHVKIRGRVSDSHVRAMRRGVRLADDRYGATTTRPAHVVRLRSQSMHDWLAITLTEGKNRQIHRMAEALGLMVLKLQRVAYGGISYFGLRVGDARELNQDELDQLRALCGLKRNPRARARGVWSATRENSDAGRRIRRLARKSGETADKNSTTSSSSSRDNKGVRAQAKPPARRKVSARVKTKPTARAASRRSGTKSARRTSKRGRKR